MLVCYLKQSFIHAPCHLINQNLESLRTLLHSPYPLSSETNNPYYSQITRRALLKSREKIIFVLVNDDHHAWNFQHICVKNLLSETSSPMLLQLSWVMRMHAECKMDGQPGTPCQEGMSASLVTTWRVCSLCCYCPINSDSKRNTRR